MPKIRIKAIPEAQKRTVSSAKEDFLRHCRVKNLSARTVEYEVCIGMREKADFSSSRFCVAKGSS